MNLIDNNFEIWPRTLSSSGEKERSKRSLHAILLQSYCISTDTAHSRNFNCWSCSQQQYDGVIVFDKSVPFPKSGKGRIRADLFTKYFSEIELHCKLRCGKLHSHDDCMLDAVHVDRLTPTHDIAAIMEGKSATHRNNRVSNLHGECFLNNTRKDGSKCHAVFHVHLVLDVIIRRQKSSNQTEIPICS